MKTLLFLLFPIVIFSQSSFKKLDSIAFMKQVDALIKTTGKDYNFTKFDRDQATKILVFENKSDNDQLIVFYYTYNEGENKNLEVSGTKVWSFKSIRANYLTLFPIWRTFVDSTADKENLSKIGYKMKGDFSFKEIDAPLWLMRF